MHMRNLTATQQEVLDEYTRRAEAGSEPPTLRELCEKFGWKSRNGARMHVLALIKKGKLASDGLYKPRGNVLTAPAVKHVNLVCGVGTGAKAMKMETELALPRFLAPDDDCFALQVDDDEMKEAAIACNDIVVVRQTKAAILGDLVVVEIGGRLVVRKIETDSSGGLVARTKPSRGSGMSVPLRHIRVRGIVRSLLRHFPTQ